LSGYQVAHSAFLFVSLFFIPLREISAALNALIADTFALYVMTKNFHCHVSGPHFRDYHLLLEEQGD